MYFLYLDETGINTKDKHFVLGGLIINSDKWQEINKKITELKLEYFSDVYVSLKGLRRYKYEFIDNKKQVNPFYYLTSERREEFSKKLKEIILTTDFTYVAAVINKQEHNKKYYYPDDQYLLSYEFIIERFERFLKEKNDYGIIFIEFAYKKLKEDLEKSHKKFLENGTKFQNITQIIESCNFVAGPENNFIQVADLFINAVFASAEYENEDLYKKYMPFIYKNPFTGKIVGNGIKYFP